MGYFSAALIIDAEAKAIIGTASFVTFLQSCCGKESPMFGI